MVSKNSQQILQKQNKNDLFCEVSSSFENASSLISSCGIWLNSSKVTDCVNSVFFLKTIGVSIEIYYELIRTNVICHLMLIKFFVVNLKVVKTIIYLKRKEKN